MRDQYEEPSNDFNNLVANKNAGEFDTGAVDRFTQTIARKRVDIEDANKRKAKALESHADRYGRQQSAAGRIASLGTDNDVVRTVTGGVARGVGSIVDGVGIAQEMVGNPAGEYTRDAGQWLQEKGDYAKSTTSFDTEQAIKDSAITGDFFDPESWDFGDDPNAAGYAHQMLGILGEFAPQAVGLLAKSPKLAQGIMAAVGFAQAGSGQAQDAEKQVNNLSDAELMDIEFAQAMASENPDMDISEIRRQTAKTASTTSFLVGGTVGGLGGAATGYILKPFQKGLQGGAAARTAKTVGTSTVEEATQELGETTLSRAATNEVIGSDRDVTKNTLGDVVLGGSFGGVMGAGGAAVSEAGRKVDDVKAKNAKRVRDAQISDVGVIKAIDEGRFSDLTDADKRSEFPRDTVVNALSIVAMDESYDAGARKEANQALGKIQEEVSAEMEALQSLPAKEELEADITKQQNMIKFLKNLRDRKPEAERTPAFMETSGQKIAGLESEIEAIRSNLTVAKDAPRKIKTLQDELTAISELGSNASVEAVKSMDVEGLMTSIEATDSTPETKAASASQLLEIAKNTPESLSREQLTKLASPSTGLAESDQLFLRKLNAAQVQENSLKSMDDVGSDIYAPQASRGFVSLPEYKQRIRGAMQRNDRKAADGALDMLSTFVVDHSRKSTAAKSALKAAQDTGKQQVIVSDGDSGWSHKPKGKWWSDGRVSENGGLTIHRGSEALVNKINKEAQVLASNYEALSLAVNGVEESANDPEPTTADASNEATTAPTEEASSSTSEPAEATPDAPTEPAATKEGTVDTAPEPEATPQPPVSGTTLSDGTDIAKITGTALKTLRQTLAIEFGQLQEGVALREEDNADRLSVLRGDITKIADIELEGKPHLQELLSVLTTKDVGATAEELQAWAVEYGTDGIQKPIIKKIMSHASVGELGAITLLTEMHADGTGEYKPAGMYFPANETKATLGFDPFEMVAFDSVSENVDVVLHEAVHAITFETVKNDPVLRKEIEEISDEIREWLSNKENAATVDAASMKYALSDSQELMAVFFGSGRRMADLAKIPSKKGGTVLSQLMQKIKYALSVAFPQMNQEMNTVLDRVLALGDVMGLESAAVTEEAPPTVTEQATPEQTYDTVAEYRKAVTTAERAVDTARAEQLTQRRTLNAANVDLLNDPSVAKKKVVDTASDAFTQAYEALQEAEKALTELQGDNIALDPDAVKPYTFLEQKEDTSGMTPDELTYSNIMKNFFTVKTRTGMGRTKDFFSTVMQSMVTNLDVLSPYVRGGQARLDKVKTKENLAEYSTMVVDQIAQFNVRIDALFSATPQDKANFFNKNPLSYLVNPETGLLDQNSKTAISQAALDFTLENGSELWANATEKEKRAVLGLDDFAEIDSVAGAAVEDAGRRQGSVIRELGKKAYDAAGFKENPDAPINKKSVIQLALGEMAMALLYDAKYMQRKTLYAKDLDGELREWSLRLAAGEIPHTVKRSKQDGTVVEENVPTDPEDYKTYRSLFVKNFFVRSNNTYTTESVVNNPALVGMSDLARGTQTFLSDVFGTESTKVYPTLEPKEFDAKTARNSNLGIPARQRKILKKENAKPRYVKSRLMENNENRKGILYRVSKTTLAKMMGAVDTDVVPIQSNLMKGVNGRNAAYVREVDALFEHVESGLQGDTATPFYLDHFVAKMQRVFDLSSSFNPQASKLHRYAMTMDGWEYEVNTRDPEDANLKEFKLGILDALGKKTDSAEDARVLPVFDELMNDPRIIKGLAIVDKLNTEGTEELTEQEEKDLLDSIGKAAGDGDGIHFFTGLMALDQYYKAVEGSGVFTTDLIREGDGKTSGPMISLLMMGLSGDPTEMRDLMNMGGMISLRQKYKGYADYAEQTAMDLYKRLAKGIDEKMLDALTLNGKTREDSKGIALLSSILGPLTQQDEAGNVTVTGAGRQAVKTPLTAIVFGAGITGTIRSMSNDFVNNVYVKMQEVQNTPEERKALIESLNAGMGEMSDTWGWKPGAKRMNSIPLDTDLLNFTFSDIQLRLLDGNFNTHFGSALKLTLETQFGSFLEARNEMNEAANMGFRFYNFALEAEKAKVLDAKKAAGFTQFDLTRAELTEIEGRLKSLVPAMDTPYSKASKQKAENAGLPMYKDERTQVTDDNYFARTDFAKNKLMIPGTGGTVATLSAHGDKRTLVEPGVATAPQSAHSIDTFPNGETYYRYNVINSHDAVHGPAHQMPKIIQQMNESFFSALENFSIPESMMSNVFRIMDGYSEWEAEFTKDMDKDALAKWEEDRLQTVRPKEWATDALGAKLKDAKDKPYKVPASNTEEMFAVQWLGTANTMHKNRLTFLSRLRTMGQYYVSGGEYTVPAAKRKELKLRAENESLFNTIGDERAKRLLERPERVKENMASLYDQVWGKMQYDESTLTEAQWATFTELAEQVKKSGNIERALDVVFPNDSTGAERGFWSKLVTQAMTGRLNNRMKKNPFESYNESIAKSRPGQLGSYRAGSPQNMKNLNTLEVLDTLANADSMVNGEVQQLGSVLGRIVNKLHGPFGKLKADIEGKAGETTVDLHIRAEQSGIYPFTSKARASGMKINKAQGYVLEQVELVMRDLLSGKALADKEIVKSFRDARDRIKPKDFYEGDWATATDNEKRNAENTHAFIFRMDTDIGESRSDHLSRFAALSMVYPPLRKALDFSPELVRRSNYGVKIGERIENAFTDMMQIASNSVNGVSQTRNTKTKMDVLVTRLVQIEQKNKLALVNQKYTAALQVEDGLVKMGAKAREEFKRSVRSPMIVENPFRLVRSAGRVGRLLADEQADSILKALEVFRNEKYRKKPLGLIMSIANEARGETEETKAVYKLLVQAQTLEQERKNLMESAKAEVLDRIGSGETLSVDVKAALTQVYLRNDLSSLYGEYSASQITELLSDKKALASAVKKTEAEVRDAAHKDLSNAYLMGAKELGYFLATGKNTSDNLFLNASNLANLTGVDATGNLKTTAAKAEQVTPLLDRLASLYALTHTDGKLMGLAANHSQNEISGEPENNGINFILQFHKGLKADAKAELFGESDVQMIKGYTKEIYNPQTQVKAATAEEGAKLEKKGWAEVHDSTLPEDPFTYNNGKAPKKLYVLRDAGLQDMVSGAVSNTGMTAKGSVLHSENSAATNQFSKLSKARKVRATKVKVGHWLKATKGYTDGFNPGTNTASKLVPVLNPEGEIANYRYVMGHELKDSMLERNNRIEDVLSGMVSHQFDKLKSGEQNSLVVNAMYDFYKDDYKQNFKAYVEVSSESPDPQLREAYMLMPSAAKQKIREVWGQDKMFIRNDLLDLVLGYRKKSAADVFNRDANVRNAGENVMVHILEKMYGKKAALRVRQSEDVWQSMVGLVKDVWVVRNLTTFVGNVMSNITLLVAYGVPMSTLVKGHKEAIDGLIRYQKDRDTLAKAELDLRTGVGSQDAVSEKIREMKHTLKRNPVHELIEEGMFQTIMEDIDMSKDDYAYQGIFDRKVSEWTGKLPAPVKKVGSELIVAKDTTTYKLLFKGTQMSDFVARYTLHKHLTSEQTQARKPMSKDDVMRRVRESFVNYDIPSHRSLQYGNDMGLLFFTKYYIRIQKVILTLMKESPARSMGVVLASNYVTGLTNIFDSSALGRMGNNPFDVGALNITDVVEEPLWSKMLLGFFD